MGHVGGWDRPSSSRSDNHDWVSAARTWGQKYTQKLGWIWSTCIVFACGTAHSQLIEYAAPHLVARAFTAEVAGPFLTSRHTFDLCFTVSSEAREAAPLVHSFRGFRFPCVLSDL